MKKIVVVLLICAMAFGAFAQISVSGSVRAKGGFSTEAKGWHGLSDGLGVDNEGSRIVFGGNWDGKAGVNAEIRPLAESLDSGKKAGIYMQNFWAWAKPASWFKVSLGWADIGEYVIKDATGTIAFDGNVRNTSKLDPIGGFINFGALAQFLVLDDNLNIGVGLFGSKPENMQAYFAVLYKIPSIGKLVVEGGIPTSTSGISDNFRVSATFQYQAKAFDIAAGIKYTGKGLGADNVFVKNSGPTDWKTTDGNFNIMVLGNFKPIEKLAISFGVDIFTSNGMGIGDSIGISYDFGPIKPIFYMYGFMPFDADKLGNLKTSVGTNTGSFRFDQVFGVEFNIPIKVGKSSFLAVGAAYDTAVKAFQVPAYFRLFF